MEPEVESKRHTSIKLLLIGILLVLVSIAIQLGAAGNFLAFLALAAGVVFGVVGAIYPTGRPKNPEEEP